MTIVSFVYAQSRNGVIGDNGVLPWHIPSDLKRFKAITLGKPVIMGRKTWDSLPRKPLPGRLNIVLTRQLDFMANGATVVAGRQAALNAAGDVPEVCVIGGAEIFTLFLDDVSRIYLTELDADVKGDTPAPPLASGEWTTVSSERVEAGPSDSAAFTLRILQRKQR